MEKISSGDAEHQANVAYLVAQDKKKEKEKKIKGWATILVLIAIGVWWTSNTPASTAVPSSASAPIFAKVKAVDLATEFMENNLSATEKYRDKKVEVTGVVSSIDKDITGTPYVAVAGRSDELLGVQCMVEDNAKAAVLNTLKKGQIVSIVGMSPSGRLGQIMRECEVIK